MPPYVNALSLAHKERLTLLPRSTPRTANFDSNPGHIEAELRASAALLLFDCQHAAVQIDALEIRGMSAATWECRRNGHAFDADEREHHPEPLCRKAAP